MGNFLIDLFKKSKKNDSFRQAEVVEKYNDNIAILNSTNQSSPSTSNLNKIKATSVESSGNTIIPGK